MKQHGPQGLYDPSFEHDACGVGFVCHLSGTPTHEIVRQGVTLLINLEHRGATGSDPCTGDGAGIMIQTPHEFLAGVADEQGFALPEAGDYGCGLVFLPTDEGKAAKCQQVITEAAARRGHFVVGWREVPTDGSSLGSDALKAQPAIWQVFIERGTDKESGFQFERDLYIIRKIAERTVAETMNVGDTFYVVSLSSKTLLYKGMLTVEQLPDFYPDLSDPRMKSALAMVHSRFSTNTFPAWPLAQPFRFLSHNGEINTVRGNANWMKAHEVLMQQAGGELADIVPIVTEGGSDSQILDNALELLYFTGRSLPHAVMMMIPEAWEHHKSMDPQKRAFYEFHACLMEAWDGPATIPFSDGRFIGAVLDRNGLRPSRYTVTDGGLVVLSSETGVLPLDAATIIQKGRLEPGKMFLVDLEEHRIIPDDEVKSSIASQLPYGKWVEENMLRVPDPKFAPSIHPEQRRGLQRLFGFTREEVSLVLEPMQRDGKEPIGSMGNDTPLAVLSTRPRPLFDYFKQLFAQVTNPPLDGIREKLVTSLKTFVGPSGSIFEESPQHARKLCLEQPILTNGQMTALQMSKDGLRTETIPMLFDPRLPSGFDGTLDELCQNVSDAVRDGAELVVLSDRAVSPDRAPIPSLLAVSAVHHHLIKSGLRTKCGLIVESGEPREVHHFALLMGYGAGAINPYLALETVHELVPEGGSVKEAKARYITAIGKGLLKIMSKMGISTLMSYRGAQIFEAIGISQELIDAHMPGTPSRIGGIGYKDFAREVVARHKGAFPDRPTPNGVDLESGGIYQWRRDGEKHVFNPDTIAHLQHAVKKNEASTYSQFSSTVNELSKAGATLRGLLQLDVDPATSIPIEEVEPWTAIVKRFKTGAMSYGSISRETHETLAVAMNQIGGQSNTGEGGEDPERYDSTNPAWSSIKQVASGRFGVTIAYLASGKEIQIKMAQGAKPGEGGQLPAKKVYPWIAKTRHSTPYVGLISPPPHHDIYSIEDLAQLIFDLKNTNPEARITVKLVSEIGVGTIAAGVAKAKADVILISGYDGGTGAAPQTSVMHAGLPWELGLAETNQTLIMNGLRSRVKVECDGQLKTGRDVAYAALLGAEEFGFATAPLVAMGCIMMRKCHLNTCPVGIATQDPQLRKKFEGKPEHVVNFFHFVAEELRAIMASLGFRTVAEMVGRIDRVVPRDVQKRSERARNLDLTRLLFQAEVPEHLQEFERPDQASIVDDQLDHWLIAQSAKALESGKPVTIPVEISNQNRTFGTMLSGEIARRHGNDLLPDGTIKIEATGSAGQSFAAFGARGLTIDIEGDANDYFGKGLSGAHLSVRPPKDSPFVAEDNVLIGNVALYGATSGKAFIRGKAGERFCVRNSGAVAVVEGIGDHGCEYMTGGRVVVLGSTGRNFGAGMSGGYAYVLDVVGDFGEKRCNTEMIELAPIDDEESESELLAMIREHYTATESAVAKRVLGDWETYKHHFVKVIPIEYKNALLKARQHSESPQLVSSSATTAA